MATAFFKGKKSAPWLLVPVIAGFLCAGAFQGPAGAQVVPLSLKDVPAPEPTNLYAFLRGNPSSQNETERIEAADAKLAAIVLGKALFWDMQVGSDDVKACASCHFNAGADIRTKNQITPMDGIFGNSAIAGVPGHPNFAPNIDVTAADFPLHTRTDPTAPVNGLPTESANVSRDTNDVISSQGVRMGDDPTLQDPVFAWKNFDQRRVEPRNAPTMNNAVFNVDMFWDGRASFIFNGVNPFGFRDRDSKVLKSNGLGLGTTPVFVRIPFGGHASQAVGPPLSNFEMSGIVRNFTDLGKKLLDPGLVPLGLQVVHPQDSVLGPYANAAFALNRRGKPTGNLDNVKGASNLGPPFLDLNNNSRLDYEDMVKAAFKDEWWDGTTTQMAENFTLFFGLAVHLYQATLISDDTPFDRFMGANANVRGGGAPILPDPNALTPQEQSGLNVFQQVGCINCHVLPETTNHVVRLAGLAPPPPEVWVNDPLNPVNVLVPQTLLELMPMGDGLLGVYDIGFYNIGVRPTDEDLGRFGTAPPTTGFPNDQLPLSLPLSYVELALMKLNDQLPPDVAQFVPDQGIQEVVQADGTVVDVPLPLDALFGAANNRFVTRGAFKVPNLRNQEFQGPYFHNGDSATLRHVAEFYARGANFPLTNQLDFDADMGPIPELDVGNPDPVLAAEAETNIQDLVAFLSRGLTDPRVANERAPFDHPQLFIPEGVTGNMPSLDKMKEIKATGAGGAGTIPRFLGLNPQTP